MASAIRVLRASPPETSKNAIVPGKTE